MYQEWNQHHLLDDINENFKTEVETNEALTMFNIELEQVENEYIDQNDINVIRRLREKALLRILQKRKQQKKQNRFFNNQILLVAVL